MAGYFPILHKAGLPGNWNQDQVCVRCYRVLRLRGSLDMFAATDVVGECLDHGRRVLIANPPAGGGVSCLAHLGGPAGVAA